MKSLRKNLKVKSESSPLKVIDTVPQTTIFLILSLLQCMCMYVCN